MKNITCNLHNVRVSSDLLFFLDRKMEKMEQQSPLNSNIRLNLFDQGDSIKGEMTVCNVHEKFLAKGQSPTAGELIVQLFEDLERQLVRWKCSRYGTLDINLYPTP